ncbi:hypothetical protein MN608_09137 [Microdochium nivale]|nr:hypothetical protein MN608_09137 [Microdochium nivale]
MSAPLKLPKPVCDRDPSDQDVAAEVAAQIAKFRLNREEETVFRNITWLPKFDATKVRRPARIDLIAMGKVILWNPVTGTSDMQDAPYGIKKLFTAAINVFRLFQTQSEDMSNFGQTFAAHQARWWSIRDELFSEEVTRPSGVTPELLFKLTQFYVDGFRDLICSNDISFPAMDPMYGVCITISEWMALMTPEQHSTQPRYVEQLLLQQPSAEDNHATAFALAKTHKNTADNLHEDVRKMYNQQRRLLREQNEIREDHADLVKRQAAPRDSDAREPGAAVASIFAVADHIETSMRDILHETAPDMTAHTVGRLRGFLEIIHCMMEARNLGDRPLRWVSFLRTRADIAEEKARECEGALLADCMCRLADVISAQFSPPNSDLTFDRVGESPVTRVFA